MSRGAVALVAALFAAAAAFAASGGRPAVLSYTMKRIDGTEQALSDYRGDVLLIVNVASRCGFTPQYEGLEALYEKYRGRGFAVLGFPANDFGNQEPGTNAEIADFCRATYSIEFPMFEKIHVTGDAIHPLYQTITSLPEPVGGPVAWNFQKYLVDRRGEVVARYSSRVAPDDPNLVARLESLLEAPRP